MTIALFLIIFLACAVEAVEALTIVLAASFTSPKAALMGASIAFAVLLAITLIATQSIRSVPLTPLYLIAGAVMFYYGVTWLRKAILRATHRKALHDETLIYNSHISSSTSSFKLAFTGVFTEGIEVILIVVALSKSSSLGYLAAIAAVFTVSLVGVIVRKPLSTIPENTLKLIVGVMLTSVGIFWIGEGIKINWPYQDLSLVLLIALLGLVTATLIRGFSSTPNEAAYQPLELNPIKIHKHDIAIP